MPDVNLRRLPDDWDGEDEDLLQAVDDATATPIYIEYSFAAEWFDGVAYVIDGLGSWVERRPKIALVLIERMIARLEDAGVDDSDGGRAKQFERLEQLRVEASGADDRSAGEPQG
jgi:hypothetical protein